MKRELSRFKQLEREILAITLVVLLMLLGVVYKTVRLIYEKDFSELWKLLAYASPLCAALLAARNASRTIANDDLNRLNELRLDVAHSTHHLIAVTRDLESRVYSIRKTLIEGGRPLFILPELARTTADRYEVLLERDTFRFLPGDCVDIITNMSGGIFGLAGLIDGIVRMMPDSDPLINLPQIQVAREGLAEPIDKLLGEIEVLIDRLFEVRVALDK